MSHTCEEHACEVRNISKHIGIGDDRLVDRSPNLLLQTSYSSHLEVGTIGVEGAGFRIWWFEVCSDFDSDLYAVLDLWSWIVYDGFGFMCGSQD